MSTAMLLPHTSCLSAEHFLPFVFHILRGCLAGKPATSVSDSDGEEKNPPWKILLLPALLLSALIWSSWAQIVARWDNSLTIHILFLSRQHCVIEVCPLETQLKKPPVSIAVSFGDANHHLSGDCLYWPLTDKNGKHHLVEDVTVWE